MPDEPYCDLCDLPLAFCSHGRVAPARSADPSQAPVLTSDPGRGDGTATTSHDAMPPAPSTHHTTSTPDATPTASTRSQPAPVRRPAVPGFLEVSPEQVAHFPGCPEKGPEVDYDAWGLVTRAIDLAWRELGEGTPVPCDSGPRARLVALTRCPACEEHGTWA